MLTTTEDFVIKINNFLKPLGFTKKGNTWYLDTDECICFFYFGKNYLGKIDHLMGCFLKEIMEEKNKFPKYHSCHLRYILDFFDKTQNTQNTILNLENKDFDSEREEKFDDLMINNAIPFLLLISSKIGIKKAVKKYPKTKLYMFIPIKKAIGIPL